MSARGSTTWLSRFVAGVSAAADHTFIFNHNGPGSPGDTQEAGKQFMKQAMRDLRRVTRV